MQGARRLAAILSADAVGYSRLMAEDEAATVAALARHRERVADLVRARNGRVVDFAGDNVLAEFPTATDAVGCALEIQDALRESNDALPEDARMEFRIGVHVGEVRAEGSRIYGSGVNIAARLEALAEPGGVCISSGAHEQVRREPGIVFHDLGARQLKNIPQQVRAFHVRRTAQRRRRTSGSGRSGPSVAVLPFVNLSADPDQAFFADGVAEELINALTRIEGLRVISRTSAFSFRGTNADVATIGERLGVGALVEGSVRRSGDRLRITAQLVDVSGGHHLWSEVYDRTLDDVFAIQDEIARTIVATIRPKLLPEDGAPLVARSTESREAYEFYLRAGERIGRVDRWETRTAIEMLKHATRVDPGFADAWARLGVACCAMNTHFDADPRWLAEGEQAVERAFALDPDNAEAHFASGRILWTAGRGFQNREALRALSKALQRQPGAPQFRLWHSLVLFHVGLHDEAREELGEVLAAQPDDAFTINILGQLAFFCGRYEEARDHHERSRSIDPTHVYLHLFTLANELYANDLTRAERVLGTARSLLGDEPQLDALEALLWAKRGERQPAEAALERALEDRPSVTHTHHTWHYAAAAYATLGRHAEALEQLRAAAGFGLPNPPLFRHDPHLRELLEEPPGRTFMETLELEGRVYAAELDR